MRLRNETTAEYIKHCRDFIKIEQSIIGNLKTAQELHSHDFECDTCHLYTDCIERSQQALKRNKTQYSKAVGGQS